MVDEENIKCIEKLILNAVPAKQTIIHNNWVLRLNEGYTYRANCICPIEYGNKADTEEALRFGEGVFQRAGIPPIVKVTPVLQKDFEDILLSRDYEKIKTVYAMDCDLKKDSYEIKSFIRMERYPTDQWLKASGEFTGIEDGKLLATHIEGIKNIAVNSVFVSAWDEGKIIGCGYGTLENGYVGIYDLHVKSEYRKRGIGTGIIKGILEYGRTEGAHKGYLIVHSKNSNAIGLYEHNGFKKVYEYSFYKKRNCGEEIRD